jgi:hypothetical protein
MYVCMLRASTHRAPAYLRQVLSDSLMLASHRLACDEETVLGATRLHTRIARSKRITRANYAMSFKYVLHTPGQCRVILEYSLQRQIKSQHEVQHDT